MKIKTFGIFFLFFVTLGLFAQQSKVETLQSFLGGALTLDSETINQNEPIASVVELAQKNAAKSIELSKENMESSLAEARNYKTCIIAAGKYTIVKITDHNDCTQSNAWATCMPQGVGYIQKSGELNSKEGYINNIIGIPDTQKRTLFLFKD